MTHLCASPRTTLQVLEDAEALASDRGVRLTSQRRRVLEILLDSPKALGAYDLLPILAADGMSDKPVVAYRALDFLVDQGFAHRIEGMNAYVACCHPRTDHTPVFMVCHACRDVSEAHDLSPLTGLDAAADKMAFTIERRVVEAVGLCANCNSEQTI